MTFNETIAHPNIDNQSGFLECCVTSFATTRLTFDEVNALRKQSATLPGNLGFSVLRHTDEQTLAALAAVNDAVQGFKNRPEHFDQWGIVASSRYLGRCSFAQALTKFAVDGPWNVSVQVVPNRSLHSPASMVGLALGCHGPCVGVGGGLDGETDAWLTAITLLQQQSLPGIWLLFCGWEPDEQIDTQGSALNAANCTTLALALQPASAGPGFAKTRIVFDAEAPTVLDIPARQTALSQFEKFVAAGIDGGQMTINLGGCLRTQMEWTTAEVSTLPMPAAFPTAPKKAA